MQRACELRELRIAGGQSAHRVVVAVEPLGPRFLHTMGELVADAQEPQCGKTRMGAVQVLAEGVDVPLQRLVELGCT